MQIGAKGTGCYKCGKTGHWSRDCTVPQSEWINRQTGQNAAQASQLPGGTQSVAPLEIPAGKKKRQPKPKLTFEILQRPKDGLPVVFLTFAERFRKKFKGPGHEAGDLRRLLEMYERWQHDLFPYLGFDNFLAEVEKIGKTAFVKRELRELRTGAIRLLEEEENQEPAAEQDQGPQGADGRGSPPQPAEQGEDPAAATAAQADPGRADEATFGAIGPAEDDEEYMLDANFEEEMFASNDEAAEKRKNLEENIMNDDLLDELMDEAEDGHSREEDRPNVAVDMPAAARDTLPHQFEGAAQHPQSLQVPPPLSKSSGEESGKAEAEVDANLKSKSRRLQPKAAAEASPSSDVSLDAESPPAAPKRMRIDSDSE